MKKSLLFLAALLPSVSFAADMPAEGYGIGAQLSELLPFVHYSEGHWFAAILSVVLWVSLIYALYSLWKKRTR